MKAKTLKGSGIASSTAIAELVDLRGQQFAHQLQQIGRSPGYSRLHCDTLKAGMRQMLHDLVAMGVVVVVHRPTKP